MGHNVEAILAQCEAIFSQLDSLALAEKVNTLNKIRIKLSEHSPFRNEPVDCVAWVPASQVSANDYNPNTVAPPEMKLLARSIEVDGYTQPIVAWPEGGGYTVVDGFHRTRVGKEIREVKDRVMGYLPLVNIKDSNEELPSRMAATIRHNRARGKHQVEAMSDIVLELSRRNWSNAKISKELGMEQDEVLRLKQIQGLAEMFMDEEFSEAWGVENV